MTLTAPMHVPHSAAPLYQLRVTAWDTLAHLVAIGGDPAGLEDARERLHRLEAAWRDGLPGNEVGRVAAGTGAVPVSMETALLVGLAEQAGRDTDGWYCPLPDARGPAVDLAQGTVTVAGRFEPGPLPRGLAVDMVVTELVESGVAGVHVALGGDLRVAGASPFHGGWLVEVAHPRGHFAVDCLRLHDCALATASVPAGGAPTSDLLSASVLSPQTWHAQAMAHAALRAGSAAAIDLLSRAGLDALLVTDDDEIVAVRGWAEHRA